MSDKNLAADLGDTLEQSFNDQELEDIMNEIENLEKDLSSPDVDSEELRSPPKSTVKTTVTENEIVVEDVVLESELAADLEEMNASVIEEVKATAEESIAAEGISDNEIASELGIEEHDTDTSKIEDLRMNGHGHNKIQDDIDKEVNSLLERSSAPVENSSKNSMPNTENSANESLASGVANNILNNERPKLNLVKTTVSELDASDAINETTMNFSVSGNMRFRLNFTIGGENVSLYVDETSGLNIEMGTSGAKFTLPVNTATSSSSKGKKIAV